MREGPLSNLGQQIKKRGRNAERRRDHDRPAPADAFGQPAPEQRRENRHKVEQIRAELQKGAGILKTACCAGPGICGAADQSDDEADV
jgi:hypothetical protein